MQRLAIMIHLPRPPPHHHHRRRRRRSAQARGWHWGKKGPSARPTCRAAFCSALSTMPLPDTKSMFRWKLLASMVPDVHTGRWLVGCEYSTMQPPKFRTWRTSCVEPTITTAHATPHCVCCLRMYAEVARRVWRWVVVGGRQWCLRAGSWRIRYMENPAHSDSRKLLKKIVGSRLKLDFSCQPTFELFRL